MDISQLSDTLGIIAGRLIRLDFRGIKRLLKVNSLFAPGKIVWNFSNMDQLFEARLFLRGDEPVSELKYSIGALPETYEYENTTKSLSEYKIARRLTALLVLKDNLIFHEEYLQGTRADDLRISCSMSKSVVSLLLGALIDKGQISQDALELDVSEPVPVLKGTGYAGVTLQQVLNMASGVKFNEDYID